MIIKGSSVTWGTGLPRTSGLILTPAVIPYDASTTATISNTSTVLIPFYVDSTTNFSGIVIPRMNTGAATHNFALVKATEISQSPSTTTQTLGSFVTSAIGDAFMPVTFSATGYFWIAQKISGSVSPSMRAFVQYHPMIFPWAAPTYASDPQYLRIASQATTLTTFPADFSTAGMTWASSPRGPLIGLKIA